MSFLGRSGWTPEAQQRESSTGIPDFCSMATLAWRQDSFPPVLINLTTGQDLWVQALSWSHRNAFCLDPNWWGWLHLVCAPWAGQLRCQCKAPSCEVDMVYPGVFNAWIDLDVLEGGKYPVPILGERRGSGSKVPCGASTKPSAACQRLSPTNSPPGFKHYLFGLPNDATHMSCPWHSSFPRAGTPSLYRAATPWLGCCPLSSHPESS